jgi:hypothetical protein
MGSFPLTLPAGTNKTISVPFKVPTKTALGPYTFTVKTTTSAGVLERTATLNVVP